MRAGRSAEVDAYVARASPFARPILVRIRNAFHAGCPGLEERIKWGVPCFEWRGMLGGMAAFQRHVSFGFWKARFMKDFARLSGRPARSSPMGARVKTLADLPARSVLVAWVRSARRLNAEGVRAPRPAASSGLVVRPPADLRAALARESAARAFFAGLPPSQRRDYVEWIVTAKQSATRERRLAQAVRWMAEGKRRNWKYERPSRTRQSSTR